MALTKVTYTDGTTVIGAQNLNNIQDAIIALEAGGGGGGSGLTEDVKQALLQIANKAAYVDTQGDTYYQDLYDALYPTPAATLTSISAVYTQPGTVYDSATLDSLKANLVVTAHYDDSSTATVASSAYTLSGTLTVGTSTITVSYQGKTTTFTVTVTAAPTNYSVTNNLTSVTNSNDATTAQEGSSYTATLSPSPSDYTINSVTITMGGTDVTGTAYSNGTISIANVTGNIVITAVATQRQATLSSISAVFAQGQNVIYDTDSLSTLKQYLTVTATWSDASTSTVADSDYTLSGTLTVGTSTITVTYGGKSDTFTVTVTAAPLVPSEYQQVEYISKPDSTANQFINTAVSLAGTGTAVIEITFMKTSSAARNSYALAIRENASGSSVCAFGVGTDNGEADVIGFCGSGTAASVAKTGGYLNQKVEAVAQVSSSGWSISDGTNSDSVSGTPSADYSSQPICLFGRKKPTTNQVENTFAGYIYNVKVTENNVVKLEMIPCKRKSDDAVGFWDRVNEVFKTSAGLTAGPDVT